MVHRTRFHSPSTNLGGGRERDMLIKLTEIDHIKLTQILRKYDAWHVDVECLKPSKD